MTFDVVIRAKPSLEGLASMITGAYLRRQAESLIAMSRATFDLTIAGRLRRMAAELQDKAAEEDDALPISRGAGGRRGCSRQRGSALSAATIGPGRRRALFMTFPTSAFSP